MTASLDSAFVLGLDAGSLLGAFNRAGVLAPADVHVARRLGLLGSEHDELVALAVAFAVRAPRVGHVRADLHSVRATVEVEIEDEVDLDTLPWPDPEAWLAKVAASPLVAVGEDASEVAPLRLVDSALHLDRYWRDERAVAADLRARAASGLLAGQDRGELAGAIERFFGGGAQADGEQRWAAAVAVLRGLAVIAGGPGTGKTTTVARVIGLLAEESSRTGGELPLVALAAPTGKAANRMQEAVRAATDELGLAPQVREKLGMLEASTVHRLLRPRPDNASRFRYHRRNRLPHDLVVIDETSMLSLWLMARLVEAVRDDARLVLVGDPEQLASVEAGAVLGDIVGPAAAGLRMRVESSKEVAAVTGVPLPVEPLPASGPAIGDGIVVLRTNHRFGGALADLAEAIRSGSGDAALAALTGADGDDSVEWVPIDAGEAESQQLEGIRRLACDTGRSLLEAAHEGESAGALEALGSWRILCAHRRGPAGVASWNARVEQWLLEEIDGFSTDGQWYVGRPVIVTANDYSLRLFNGDTGVLVARQPAGVVAAFEQGPVSPSRLSEVETVYAMTVHKAQGSEFDHVAVVLPQPTSRILTRELLYTAVTRARRRLILAGTEEAVRAAVERPIARASGLTERLWGASR
ncbi:MAG TPA: exodeoxyribonuclease V subunit alpha [Acidimicrobiales bacterium]|nr:exodeoxyribonuclease V subunit alpha [Acidimicrobiales bacterium]